MAVLKPKRGEVWWVQFDPTIGSEVKKTRPAIIVSNDVSNRYLDRCQVIPVTSQIATIYPSECLVRIATQSCKAMTDQIRTISNSRLGKKIAVLSAPDVALLEQTMRLQLGLL